MESNQFCTDSGSPDKLCWIAVLTDPRVDISRVQDDVMICHNCERFKTIAHRGSGRRAADQAISLTIAKLMEQLALKRENLEKASLELKNNVEQLSLLKNITDAIARSDSLEKGLRIILTGATSGDAFGFNRAVVFLVNDQSGCLEGKCAIGPENPDEARHIWNEIANIPIARLLEEILIENEFVPCDLETMASAAKVSLSDKDNPLAKALSEAKERIIDTKDKSFSELDWSWWPYADKLAVAPLVSEGKSLGLLLADNAITGRQITPGMVDSLRSLANACAPGLENTILRQKLFLQLKELERAHDLLKANQSYLVRHERLVDIGMLATKVAHEFKIPLVTIGGYARRIINTLGTDKFDREMVNVIIGEVDRLLKLNSEILEYSRVARLSIRDCDLNSIIGESLSLLQDRFKDQGIKAEKKFSAPKLRIKADPERLKQVILNLVENAVEAMRRGGRLTIRTIRRNDYVVIEIEDTGVGIDKEGIENLFKLFYTTKENGSGLGLSVSKKIVDDHGGYINVNSSPGVGTVFAVHLPALDDTEDAANNDQ